MSRVPISARLSPRTDAWQVRIARTKEKNAVWKGGGSRNTRGQFSVYTLCVTYLQLGDQRWTSQLA